MLADFRVLTELLWIGRVQVQDARVKHGALLKRRPHGSVKTVLQIHVSMPFDDMREEVAEERRIIRE